MRTEDYIADNIIALCKKRDMSKYRLSQLTGISQSSIGKIIAKESLPTMPTVEKICDALGVTMAQMCIRDRMYGEGYGEGCCVSISAQGLSVS